MKISIPSDASVNVQRAFEQVDAELRQLGKLIKDLDTGASSDELRDLRKEIGRKLKKSKVISWADVFGTMLINGTELRDYWLRETFRGVKLRTHPDISMATSRVMLTSAEEIVFDDGYRVAVTAPLTADVTTVGFRGRDAGSESASTWYEVYAVRKHRNDTLGLMLHQAKDYFLDEESSAGEDGQHMLRRATAPVNTRLGQGFTVSNSGYVEFVDLRLRRGGAVAAGTFVAVAILANSAGLPTGANLAISDKLEASTISTSAQWVRFVFREPVQLTAGTQYHLVMSGDYTASDTVNVSWRADTSAGAYANGSKSFEAAGVWTADADDDFIFRIYVTRNDTEITLPTDVNQKCKIGYVYNDSGSNFVPFVAMDRFVSPLTTQSVATVTETLPTLVSIPSIIPPGSVAMICSAFNATVDSRNQIGPVPDAFGMADQSRSAGGARQIQPLTVASMLTDMAAILTEYQGAYTMVSAGSALIRLENWRW